MNTASAVNRNIEIGRRMKARRESLGYSLEYVASIVETNKTTIMRYENGTIQKPKIAMLESIARAISVNPAWLIGKSDTMEQTTAMDLPDKAVHVALLYDAADEHSQEVVDLVLRPFEAKLKAKAARPAAEPAPEHAPVGAVSAKVTPFPKKRARRKEPNDGFMQMIGVYDQPSAAGLGNYLDAPISEQQQYPPGYIPDGTDFGVKISGNSMEPQIADGATVFVQEAITVREGEIGIFVHNGEALCKQFFKDEKNRRLILRSLNPAYEDRIVDESVDRFKTIGRVLGWYPVREPPKEEAEEEE